MFKAKCHSGFCLCSNLEVAAQTEPRQPQILRDRLESLAFVTAGCSFHHQNQSCLLSLKGEENSPEFKFHSQFNSLEKTFISLELLKGALNQQWKSQAIKRAVGCSMLAPNSTPFSFLKNPHQEYLTMCKASFKKKSSPEAQYSYNSLLTTFLTSPT